MNVDKTFLTICIPTYNRKNYLEKQLVFFQKQVERNPIILQKVRFIISNNSSTDDTLLMLNSWDKRSMYFEHFTNDKNLGLVGNIRASLNRANTKYVWFISDDDQLKDGIIEKVIDALSMYNPEYLFINYSSANNLKKVGYTGNPGYQTDAKSTALDIFNETYGSLVFLTASVYKRDNLLEIYNDKMSSLLSGPLLYSFYSCSKGPIYIIGEPLIIFNPGNASYAGLKRVLKLKFEEYIKILERLVEFGYDRKEVYKTIKTFFRKQSHSHFLYNFVNFSKSIQYYKYYDLKTFFYLPINVVSYLSSVLVVRNK